MILYYNLENINLKNTNIDNYSICFIISCKYYRNYTSYIKFYIDNIINFYTNYLIIIIDNNSININDLVLLFNHINYKNIIILTNNIECKFEIGAYKIGIMYLFKNNLINNYDYYVFTQDTFVLKNKYDFNLLKSNNILACPIYEMNDIPYDENNPNMSNIININNYTYNILKQINLYNESDTLKLCWCHSFILCKTKLIQFYNYVNNIIITNRFESEASERYLYKILYVLNNNKNNYIDNNNSYNTKDININYNIFSYFEKKMQDKTEKTLE